MARAKQRTVTNFTASTPANYRAFLRLIATTACAERMPDGTYTVRNESKWSACADACEVTEA
jgi:hypothetical protein